MTLKLNKFLFFADTIDYLVHILRPSRLEISQNTTDATRGLKNPTIITDLESFSGLCNVFRRFVQIFARIATPLTAKLRKYQPAKICSLCDVEKKARTGLKEKLVSPPIFAMPKLDWQYNIYSDSQDRKV